LQAQLHYAPACVCTIAVVNAYAALAQQEYFDRIDSIDILDVLKTGCA